MNKLPLSTVELITSTQVIISLVSVVKELVENSLDSDCDSIDVRLDENGLSKIEVQDNGTGIALEDIQYVCKQHYTSKIRNELDLLNLTQYGFRGEALFSICSVGDVFITTKTKADQVSKKYSFSKDGEIINSEITHHNVGTIVTVLNLFKALPVRRKLYEKNRKVREEVKCIEELLISYGIVMPKLRITLKYDKNIIWRKDRAANCSLVLSALFGSNVLNNLKEIEYQDEELQVKAYIPKVGSASNVVGRTLADRMFIIVNKRPVRSKEIKSLLKTSYNNNCCQGKYPFSVLMIEVKPDQIDVNLHPNKMDILLQNTDILLEKLNKLLTSVYSQSNTRNITPEDNLVVNCEESSMQVVNLTHLNTDSSLNSLPSVFNDSSNNPVKLTCLQNKKTKTQVRESLHLNDINLANSTIDANKNKLNEETILIEDNILNFDDKNDFFFDFEFCKNTCQQNNDSVDNCHQITVDQMQKMLNKNTRQVTLDLWKEDEPLGEPASVLKPKLLQQHKVHNKKDKQEHIKDSSVSASNAQSPKLLTMSKKQKENIKVSSNKVMKRDRKIVNFSFEDLSFKRLSETDQKLETDQQINIIGNLPNTCLWVVQWKNELFCVDKIRSSEMLLYKKMYETHQLTQKKLIHPIKLNFEFLGENLFQKLSHIETDAVSGCLGRTFANLLNNGFSLRYVKKPNSKEDYFECTHMNDVIPGYGIDDLLQILENVDIFSDKPTSVIRTERACSWFKNEAARLSQISTCSREEFEMHFNQWILIEDILWQDRLCFHGRPIVMYINKITESDHS
ncbi:PMS1 protein homolog 1 isoform X3 [Hydra vulgaris]|uniref:PMS1 protein homolog 1 isoform X3 n=1 Tax=Hydra vulgaris TaxID=6087 RepID=A0ABM4CXZ1_HYDVU